MKIPFSTDFDIDSDELNEGPESANLPKLTISNDNLGVMKSQPKSKIEFIEKISYVERKPFLGIDRQIQTE